MKKRITILGCGSSLGSPWINSYKGNCNIKNIKNLRTRSCIHIEYGPFSILIDTSPDIRQQMMKNNITKIDNIFYTHHHADQTSGIFEFRAFYLRDKKKIPVICNNETKKKLYNRYPWLFKDTKYYSKIMFFKNLKKRMVISKQKNKFKIDSFKVIHGDAQTTGYLFNKVAYIPDCKKIPSKSLEKLKGLNYLIIDCFRPKKFISHLSLEETLEIIKYIKPKKSILTNLHVDFDYEKLKNILPKNIFTAYDNLKFNF